MNGPNRACYQFYESFERSRTCSISRPIVPSVPHPVLTVVSLEGIARNMPEICVWQLAFDIQSCRASLTKRVTNTHTHTPTHTHTYVYTLTQPNANTHPSTYSHTHGHSQKRGHSAGLQFICNNVRPFFNVAFSIPCGEWLEMGYTLFLHECINYNLFYILLISNTAF